MNSGAAASFLILIGSILLGVALGGLVGWRSSEVKGLMVGLLTSAAGGLSAAVFLTSATIEVQQHAVTTTGRVIEVIVEESEVPGIHREFDDRGLTHSEEKIAITIYVPLVQFIADDGKTYQFKGLGSSPARYFMGDEVAVKYVPGNPQDAVIGDFQHQWAKVFAFWMIAGFELIFGLFMLAETISEHLAKKRQRQAEAGLLQLEWPPGHFVVAWRLWQARWGKWIGARLKETGIFTFVAIMVYTSYYSPSFLPRPVVAFFGVALAMAILTIGSYLYNDGWRSVIGGIIMVIFATMFGVLFYLLSAD